VAAKRRAGTGEVAERVARPARKGAAAPPPEAAADGSDGRVEKLAMAALWLLVLLPPLYVSPSAQDPFRLPKLMLCEWLAIASLLPLAWALRGVERVGWRDVWGLPAVRAALPLALVASAGLFTSAHPLHVRSGHFDLWIGVACLAGWSAALGSAALARLLAGLLWPAAILAALAILQSLGLQPLSFAGIAPGSRLAITATAGNPGDLGAYLVLPCLVAQWRLARGAAGAGDGGGTARGKRRGSRPPLRRFWPVAALAICAYALALTQTFAALAAVLLGSLVFWSVFLRRSGAAGRRFALAAAVLAVLALGAVAAVPALRSRVAVKAAEVRSGDWNAVLTGRVDGWRTALWMLAQHPWAGVGQGAYRAEFVPAKLALIQRGVAFFNAGEQQNFVNAHDEAVEVGADCGVPGLLALAWGFWVLVSALRAGGAGLGAGEAGQGAGDESGKGAGRSGQGAVESGKSAARSGQGAVESAKGAGGSGKGAGRLAQGAGEAGMGAGEVGKAARGHGAFGAAARSDAALRWAGAAALGVLCLVDFPFRIGLVAFPALLLLAWVLRPAPAAAAAEAAA
jgi:O-antigen ligase